MARKVKVSNTVLAAIVTIAFSGAIFCFWDLYYAVNDDVTTGKLLSGAYTGIPHPAGSLIRYPLACVISFLFRVFPEIDCYGIFLVGSHFICFYIVLKEILHKFPADRIKVVILASIIFATVEIPNITLFQFTTTATVYAATGVFVLFLARSEVRELILSVALVLISLCVRKDTFTMILPFLALTWLFKICRDHNEIKKIVKEGVLYFTVLGIMAYGINSWHHYANIEDYTNEVRQQYVIDRNNIRDYDGVPDYDTHLEYYQAMGGQGLPREEYTMIRNQMVTMDFSMDIMDIVKDMHQYNEVLRGYVDVKYKLLAAKSLFMALFSRVLVKPQFILACITFVLMGIYFIIAKKWLYCLCLSGGFFGTLAEGFILLYRGRMPERVMQSLLVVAFVWMFSVFADSLYNLSDNNVGKNTMVLERLAAVLYSGFFLCMLVPAINGKQVEYAERYRKSTLVNEYCAAHKDNVYFSPYSFLSGDTSKLGSRYMNRFDNRIRIGLGSFASTYYDMMARAGIVGTMEEAIMTQENVFLMGYDTEGQLMAINDYFAWKYGDAYSYEIVDSLDDSIYVWKVHLEG